MAAYHLAFHDGEMYQTSPHGFFEPYAAEVAAPSLNISRVIRGYVPYSHVIVREAGKPIDIQPLESQ